MGEMAVNKTEWLWTDLVSLESRKKFIVDMTYQYLAKIERVAVIGVRQRTTLLSIQF